MSFSTDMIKNINSKVPLWTQKGNTWTYTFVRIPTENPRVEVVMYSEVCCNNNRINRVDKMSRYCTLVDNVPYNCAYISDIDRCEDVAPDVNRSFFRNSFKDVASNLAYKVREKLLKTLEALPDSVLVPDEKARAEMTSPERLADSLHKNIIGGVAPTFKLDAPYIGSPDDDAIDYLLNPEKAVEAMYNSVIHDDENEYSAWTREKRSYFSYKARKAYFDAHKDSLSDVDIEIRRVNDALENAQKFGAKTVTLFVDGDDSIISQYVRSQYPDFSIAGKMLEIKAGAKLKVIDNRGFIRSWQVSVENVTLKKKWSNKKEDFLKDFHVSKIRRITYRKKDLYVKD